MTLDISPFHPIVGISLLIGFILLMFFMTLGTQLLIQRHPPFTPKPPREPVEYRYAIAKILTAFSFFIFLNSITFFYIILFNLPYIEHNWGIPAFTFFGGLATLLLATLYRYAK